MDASGQNYKDTSRYTDVEYTPDGHTDVYRWDDFLGIAGGHVYSAMDTIDMVSTGGQYEGDEPEHAYACEVVGCCGLSDGVALFRPVSHDGADLIQIAFLRNDVDDATGAYTERFEAGSFDLPAADLPRSESRVDLLEYFSGRSFKHTPGVNRGLDPRETVDSIEDAIGCDLGLFDGFWLGVPGEADMRVGPYTKKSLLDFSYYAKELSCRYGLADSDILEIARHLPEDGPAFMLPQGATRGDIIRGCLACDGIVGALRENAGMRSAAAGWLDSYFTEVAGRAPVGETCSADCLFACHVDIDGIYAERTGNPDGLRAYCDPMGVGWNHGPIYYFPRESIEQIVAQLIDDGDDFPVLFDGERVIEAFDGSPVHMSVPVEVDGEKVWTCGYDFCWGETVAPDFSRARGRFPDATVAAWAAERSVNGSDVNLGIKERML